MTSISEIWAMLDTDVQQWLLDNPGTHVLPRFYVNQVPAGGPGAGQCLRLDEHGDYWLTPEEMLFLTARRQERIARQQDAVAADRGGESTRNGEALDR